ncbi:acyl-CoA thioesterase II [Cryptococcus neoformans c45]|nr:acyl-CoA thioesterase II [Cryptococcus neoformans var. grubii c45]
MGEQLANHVTVTPHPIKPLTYLSQNLWVPSGARGVFGGQILAQAILAATSSISSPLGLHSAHCYFLLPAQRDPEIEYRVEKLSDARSYSSRLVRAWQGEKEIFVLMASYALPPNPLPSDFGKNNDNNPSKDGSKHLLAFSVDPPTQTPLGSRKVLPKFELPFPDDMLPPSDCEEDADFLERWIRERESKNKKVWEKKFFEEYIQERKSSPVSIARARRASTQNDIATLPQVRMSWLRIKSVGPDRLNEEVVKAMIAYMSDFQFIGTTARSVGLNQNSNPRLGMLASLDHVIHFYPFPDTFDPSAPLLHVMEAQAANLSSGRGIARGRIYTHDGHLIAVTGQEGVVRAEGKGGKRKGLIEGGMDEADVRKNDAKAKL